MKKSKKLLAFLMGATMLAASLFGGCDGMGYTEGAKEGAPNYSLDYEAYNWGFSMVRDNWIMFNGEKIYSEESFQTKEKTQQLKDVGYNMVFIDWTFSDLGFKKNHEGTTLDRVVRDCEEVGLKTLWYGSEFHAMSRREESNINPAKWRALEETHRKDLTKAITEEYTALYYDDMVAKIKFANPDISNAEAEEIALKKLNNKIEIAVDEQLEEYIFVNYGGEGIFFKSQEQYNKFAKWCLEDEIADYPSFAGVSLVDEPNYKMFQAIRETVIALQSVDPDMYLMINLLPMSTNSGIHVSYCENGKQLGMVKAYQGYLDNYWKYLGGLVDFIMYDDYPICRDGVLSTFLQCHQMVANFAKEHNLKRRVITQTYDVGNRRVPDYPGMLYQFNIALAFGATEVPNYMYLPNANSNGNELPNENNYVVKFNGDPNPLYYYLKDSIVDFNYMVKYLHNFKYQGMNYQRTDTTAPTGWSYIMGLTNDEFTKLTNAEFKMFKDMGGLLLITELYDEVNKQWGYYVVNGTDPGVSSEMRVTLTFDGYKNAQLVQSQNTMNVALKNNQITIDIGTGRGAFIMPY